LPTLTEAYGRSRPDRADKILKLHQIRYHVTLWPYDVTWNGIAVIMIIAGIVLMQGRAGVATPGLYRTDGASSWPSRCPN
jgi:Predicted membrane protein (DUF2243)